MKKWKLLSVIFALFFRLSILSLADEAYIASFNILRLGSAKKNMIQTAKILQGFDIVGLVEVINRDGVEELVDELNCRLWPTGSGLRMIRGLFRSWTFPP